MKLTKKQREQLYSIEGWDEFVHEEDVREISERIAARGSLPEITSEDVQEREDAAKMEELYNKFGGAWLMQMCEKYAIRVIPANPEEVYKGDWVSLDDFLGVGNER